MEKDWTGSAMPSVLKSFSLIGQPIGAEEFEKAFGYKIPEIKLSEEEKRRAAQNTGLEPEIRQEEKQPVAKTEKTVLSFGRDILAQIKAGNARQAEQQEQKYLQPDPRQDRQDPPLEIENRGVGNSQTEENKSGTSQTNKDRSGTIKTDDPYTAKTLETIKKQNNPTNSTPFSNRTINSQERNPANTNEQKTPTTYRQTGKTTPLAINTQTPSTQTGPNETGNPALNYFLQIGENENTDNIAAQPDPEENHPNAHEIIRQGINRATKNLVKKSADINRQQQQTGEQNHLLNWVADVARDAMKDPVTHPRQDYQSGYQTILEHEANRKLAEAAGEGIETHINGKEKHQIVKDAFNNKYITEPGKLGLAIVSLTDHALATLNGDKPINPTITKNIDNDLFDLIEKNKTWLKNSIPIEKLNQSIIAGDDTKTIENLTQFGYELIGENGPWAAISIIGAPQMSGAAVTGAGMSAYKLVKDYTINLAEANASIVKETGTHNWELAFKIASLKVIGGRAIDGQIKSLIKTGGKRSVFIEQLGDALKKRFNSMVDDFYFNKDKERDKGQQ